MNSLWMQTLNSDNIYFINARCMAHFGLLKLNKGKWNGTAVLAHADYFNT